MKILHFMPYAAWDLHFGTDLEIARTHVLAGDEVHVLQCASELATCDVNPAHDRLSCMNCHARSNAGLDRAGVGRDHRHTLGIPACETINVPRFSALEDLMAYRYRGVAAGRAIASSLISHARDTRPDFARHADYLRRTTLAYLHVFDAVTEMIAFLNPDRVYLFNGRFATLAAAFAAARTANVTTFVHERAGINGRYILCENTWPIDLAWTKRELDEARAKMESDPTALGKGEKWFEESRMGRTTIDFLGDQRRLQLPENFDPAKRNIALCGSTDDEFETIEEWTNPFGSQINAIRAILDGKWGREFHFYLRVHPLLKGLDNTQLREIQKLSHPQLTIIAPEAAIDSYALANACEKVVSFGTTLGIEAAYWGKPVILAGHAFYEHLDAIYRADDVATLHELIGAHLLPRDRKAAAAYGYWMQTRGIPFRHFAQSDSFSGLFLGEPLRPRFLERVVLNVAHRLRAGLDAPSAADRRGKSGGIEDAGSDGTKSPTDLTAESGNGASRPARKGDRRA